MLKEVRESPLGIFDGEDTAGMLAMEDDARESEVHSCRWSRRRPLSGGSSGGSYKLRTSELLGFLLLHRA